MGKGKEDMKKETHKQVKMESKKRMERSIEPRRQRHCTYYNNVIIRCHCGSTERHTWNNMQNKHELAIFDQINIQPYNCWNKTTTKLHIYTHRYTYTQYPYRNSLSNYILNGQYTEIRLAMFVLEKLQPKTNQILTCSLKSNGFVN